MTMPPTDSRRSFQATTLSQRGAGYYTGPRCAIVMHASALSLLVIINHPSSKENIMITVNYYRVMNFKKLIGYNTGR
jgi:hypothetical protein